MNIFIVSWEDLSLFMKYLPQSWWVSTWDSSVNMHIVPDPGKTKMLMKNGHTLSALSVCWTSARITSKEGKEVILPQSIPYHFWDCPWAHGRQNYFYQTSPWFHNCILMDHNQVPFSRKQCEQGPLSLSFWSLKCFSGTGQTLWCLQAAICVYSLQDFWGILISSKTHFLSSTT